MPYRFMGIKFNKASVCHIYSYFAIKNIFWDKIPYYRIIFFSIIVFSCFILHGCSTNNDEVDSMSKGEVHTNVQPWVIFKQNVIQSDKVGVLYHANFKLNGQDIKAQYVFTHTNKMTVMLPTLLDSNTSYTLEIPMQEIAKELQTQTKSSTIIMKFKTLPLSLDVENIRFTNINATTTKLQANIILSQDTNLKTLSDSLTLQDDTKKTFTVKLTQNNNNKREFALESQSLTIPASEDKNLTLQFKAKNLGLRDDMSFPIILNAITMLSVLDIKAQVTEKPSISIRFSNELAKNVNLKDYIKISPMIDFDVAQSGNMIHINGAFQSQTQYEISVLKGIKANNKTMLKETYTAPITINDMFPAIVFSSSGVFLPQSANKRVAFKTMNVKKITAKVSKVYPNNFTQFLYDTNFVSSINNNSYYNVYGSDFYRIGDEVLTQTFDIDTNKNSWVQSELDLSTLKDSHGIFIVELSFDKKDVDYKFAENEESWKISNFFDTKSTIKRHLVFSNIALLAQNGDDTITATALNIVNNTPMSNVMIHAINKKNQTIAKVATNANGDAILPLKKQDVLYLLAENKGDVAILKLNSSVLSNDGFDVGGENVSNGMKAFIYSDRGVYRPGDSIHLNAIVRNNAIVLPSDHPISLTLTTPRGKKALENRVVHQVGDGMYYYKFDLPKDADTGVWNLKIDVGGNAFYKDISVETVIPDRIKVAIKADNEIDLTQQKKLQFSLQSDYLFGAPASDLDYTTEIFIQTQEFKSKLYKNYTFTTTGSMNYRHSDNKNGKLDSNGFVENNFDLSNLQKINGNLRANLVAKVFEKSSRMVTTRKSIDLKYYDSFVGIGNPDSNYIPTNKEISLPIIAIASDDSKLLAGRMLSYKIYRNSYSWWWDYDDYGDFIRSIKNDKNTEVIAEGTLITKDKPIFLKHTFDNRGEILVEVTDVKNGVSSAISLYATQWGEPIDTKKITSLKIWSDKKEYVPGDTAKVSFESIAGAKALITLNKNGKILKRFWKTTQDSQTTVDIPVDSGLAPNGYVSVSLLQDYNTTDNDRSLRLYGVIPIMVTDKKTKLNIHIEAPKEIKPGDTFEVKISNEENKKATFSLAIVDEGLLSLTDFKTPNPWNYFYAKLPLALQTSDTYDLIVGKTFGKVHNILRVGGDEEMVAQKRQKSDETAERFKPVVLYNAPMSTDDKGNAVLKFTMPTYIGNVRIMAVASNENAIGSKEENIKVSAPVVMMPTIPRSLKIGDKFSLPVELFSTQDSIKKAKITIKANNGLVKFQKNTTDIQFNNKKSQIIVFEGEVTQAMGVENLAITIQAGNYTMTDSTEIDIKPINPYITITQKHVVSPNKEINIDAPNDFVAGSNRGFLTISGFPILTLDHRLRWLIRYPYGCIEQTTSSVLPQIFIDRLSHAQFVNKNEITNNINAAIRRIQGFQVSNGGFSYWQGGNTSDSWGSNYAGHFLILAKENGYSVPNDLMKRWIQYQINSVKSNDSNTTRIYSLYLLALVGEPQIGVMNEIYENGLRNISIIDTWLLGAAYKLAGFDDIARKITHNISTTPNSSERFYYDSYGSSLRDEAIILLAYKTIYDSVHEALLNTIATELESDSWLSTQTLGYSLLSLAKIKEDSQNTPISGTITLNKEKQSFNHNTPSLQFSLYSGKAHIVSTTPQDIYVSYVWEGIPISYSMSEIAKNIILKREFLNDKGEKIDVSNLTSGSTFWIKLTLSNVDKNVQISNIALTQGMPSGWEIENLRLNHDSMPSFIQQSNIAYTDIRDDKVMWFFDYNSYNQKNVVVFTKINVVTPGEYTLPPAYAEAMYDNNYQASIPSMKVKVKAK